MCNCFLTTAHTAGISAKRKEYGILKKRTREKENRCHLLIPQNVSGHPAQNTTILGVVISPWSLQDLFSSVCFPGEMIAFSFLYENPCLVSHVQHELPRRASSYFPHFLKLNDIKVNLITTEKNLPNVEPF